MTTKEVANRLVELCRQGKIEETLKELYADNAVSIEADDSMGPRTTEGLPEIIKKGEMFNSMVQEFHGAVISDPVVGGNSFAISWDLDVTMKGKDRMQMSEVCAYKVKDGKIVLEQFFY
ncbi:MAG: nuclear transport factor 2 family protein [Ginsengibacter sp.]